MKVVVSSSGRFHSFRLAGQLYRLDALECLFVEDFRRKDDRIPGSKVKGLIRLKLLRLIEILSMFAPFLQKHVITLRKNKKNMHDSYVAGQLKKMHGIDIFVGWQGSCFESLRVAKERGMITIVECGSTHPLFQASIVDEEYRFALGKDMKSVVKRKKEIEKAIEDLKECDYIAIPSQFVKRSFIEKGFPESKLIVVPYGVDLGQFKKVQKKDRIFRIVWTGTVCIRKGLHYLLQAFSELNLPGAELALIGSVDKDMKTFIDKYRHKNIKYYGPKPQSSLYRYYSQGSVFVHPSVEEGLSMVQLEAMACGLPLICTTNTGGEDVIREGKEGFVIPIRDVAALKEKIKYMYDNPEKCSEMGVNARKRVKDFTWDRYGDRIIANYRKIIKNRKIRPTNKK